MICGYAWPVQPSGKTFYVSHLPSGPADWGWTQERSKAIRLSPGWVTRFVACAHACNWRYFVHA